jgi:hypothetical protein
MGRTHQKFLNGQILLLEDRLKSVQADLDTAQTEEQRKALGKRARQLTKEIDEIYNELDEDERQCDSSNFKGVNSSADTIRKVERRWAEYLHHVNHRKAKVITDDILMKFQSEPGDSLFVFQDAADFLGERYLRYLKNQIENSKIGCCSPPCLVGFITSQPNSIEFLSEFCQRLNIKNLPSQDFSVECVLDGLQSVLESCTIFFMEVHLSDSDENSEFIDWFIHEFWQPLIGRVDRVRQINPLFVCIGAVTLEAELEEEFLKKIRFSMSDRPEKLVVFDREIWEEDEIKNWMTRYSGIPLPFEEQAKVAQKILKYQKEIPSRAEEKLREELRRLAG